MQVTPTTDDYLSVGKIAKAHGIKGEVKVVPYSASADELLGYRQFYLQRAARFETLQVVRSRVQGRFTILQLRDVRSRDAAEALVGHELSVLKSEMPALAEDEIYWHELIGLKVLTDQGRALGTVASLMATGANDVMVVKGDGQEYLIPVLDGIIDSIDMEKAVLIIKPLPGLLEMNVAE